MNYYKAYRFVFLFTFLLAVFFENSLVETELAYAMKGKGICFSDILGKEVRLYTRKRDVRLCSGVSFLYTLGKEGSIYSQE